MDGVEHVTVLFEGRPGGAEFLHRPSQIPRDKGDLCLGEHASRVGHGLLRPKGTRRTLQEILSLREIAQLRHGDASQGQGRGIFAQRHKLERTQGIASSEGGGSRRDERVHEEIAPPLSLTTRTAKR